MILIKTQINICKLESDVVAQILVLMRLRQEDLEFKPNLNYIGSLPLAWTTCFVSKDKTKAELQSN